MGVQFQNLRLDQEINSNGIEAVNKSIGIVGETTVVGSFQGNQEEKEIDSANGIIFRIHEDGEVRFVFDASVMGNPSGNPLHRIIVNGESILSLIDKRVGEKVTQMGIVATQRDVTNAVANMLYNPLWGKKLAVIGDSFTCSPTKNESYSYFIANRNNMTLVNNGRSGERLCESTTNSVGQITNPSTISSYTNDIPTDADFILCQIGANDFGNWWKRDNQLSVPVPDTDLSTETFKGCWNNLLIGLKKNYPNAKIGIILAHDWGDNFGQDSEDVHQTNGKREMTQWQKIQCQRLNIPVFDPVDDTRMIAFNYRQYSPTNGTTITQQAISDDVLDWYDRVKRDIGTDQSMYKDRVDGWVFQTRYFTDSGHMTARGNLLMSFFYENWMKTVLMAN